MNELRQKYPLVKPHTLAMVADPRGFSFVGEIMSFPVPGDVPTAMVRRVPGHPGTLEELPLSCLSFDPHTAAKRKWIQYARIMRTSLFAGRYFPLDMLRYEEAAPVNFRIDDDGIPHLLRPEYPEDFMIATTSSTSRPQWAQQRWESFGWDVLHLSSQPYVVGS